MAPKAQKTDQPSPFKIFNNWLFDDNIESTISEDILKVINPCNLLQMFSNFGSITIFLNNTLNNYYLYTLNKMDLCKYLKSIIYKKRLNRYNTSFFMHHKEDKDLTKLHMQFPMIKRYEVYQLLKYIQENTKEYDDIMSTLGFKEEKSKKLTVEEKKQYLQTDTPPSTPTEKKRGRPKKVVEQVDVQPVVEQNSFEDWTSNFS